MFFHSQPAYLWQSWTFEMFYLSLLEQSCFDKWTYSLMLIRQFSTRIDSYYAWRWKTYCSCQRTLKSFTFFRILNTQQFLALAITFFDCKILFYCPLIFFCFKKAHQLFGCSFGCWKHFWMDNLVFKVFLNSEIKNYYLFACP